MGGGGSKSVADVQEIANTPITDFMPPLGPVNPVRTVPLVSFRSEIAAFLFATNSIDLDLFNAG